MYCASFNPRPPLPRGDAARHNKRLSVAEQFQSTPPVAEGRCARGVGGAPGRNAGFNPRPPLPRGDAPLVTSATQLTVGFNPRPPLPRGDAVGLCNRSRGSDCFNPRPPLPRGDALGRNLMADPVHVSIHAPRCRGAMRWRWSHSKFTRTFQSTPPVAEGRCLVSLDVVARLIGFNPRPPLPRGDASRNYGLFHMTEVSIHAPRCRGAMHLSEGALAMHVAVSIHAPRCRGAMRYSWFPRCLIQIVSIHAPRCRGAMPDLLKLRDQFRKVSIHAPRCRGAMPGSAKSHATATSFNPRPPLPRGDAGAAYAAKYVSKFQSTPPVAEGRCTCLRLSAAINN